MWNLDNWTAHGDPLTGHHGWIWSLTAVPGLADTPLRLASAGADHSVRLWDPISGRPVGEPLTKHTDQVRVVTCVTSTDGRGLLISGGHDGTIRLWHPTYGVVIHTIPLGIPVHALLPQTHDPRSHVRTAGGATITVGLRTGILSLDIHNSLFPH